MWRTHQRRDRRRARSAAHLGLASQCQRPRLATHHGIALPKHCDMPKRSIFGGNCRRIRWCSCCSSDWSVWQRDDQDAVTTLMGLEERARATARHVKREERLSKLRDGTPVFPPRQDREVQEHFVVALASAREENVMSTRCLRPIQTKIPWVMLNLSPGRRRDGDLQQSIETYAGNRNAHRPVHRQRSPGLCGRRFLCVLAFPRTSDGRQQVDARNIFDDDDDDDDRRAHSLCMWNDGIYIRRIVTQS